MGQVAPILKSVEHYLATKYLAAVPKKTFKTKPFENEENQKMMTSF